MRLLGRAYTLLILAFAVFAGILLAAALVAILYDVIVRTVGFQPPQGTVAFTEYALVFITMLTAPWLVRVKGHVVVETLMHAMPPAVRRVMAKLAYALCIVLALILFYFSLDLTIASYRRGDLDVQAVEVPRWLQFVAMPPSFLLIAIEFARYLFGRETYYSGKPGPSESL